MQWSRYRVLVHDPRPSHSKAPVTKLGPQVLVRGTTHAVHQLIAEVDRLPPPTDSRWKGTV